MMALFQPFKPTKRMPGSKLTAATFRQGMLDQQAKRDENAIRSANQKGIVGLGGGINQLAGNPIGEYLREMLGGGEVDPLRPPTEATAGGTQTGAPPPPTDSLPDPYAATGQAAAEEAAVDQSNILSLPDPYAPSGEAAVEESATGNLFAPTYSAPDDLSMEGSTELGAQAGAEAGEAATDPDSLRGILENLFSGGGGDAAVEAGTEAALEQGGEQALEAGAEEAGGSMVPGMGSIMSLAEGDAKGAAAKLALTSMLPPPYGQILSMLI
jgi:hypothetical protein